MLHCYCYADKIVQVYEIVIQQSHDLVWGNYAICYVKGQHDRAPHNKIVVMHNMIVWCVMCADLPRENIKYLCFLLKWLKNTFASQPNYFQFDISPRTMKQTEYMKYKLGMGAAFCRW